MGCNNKQAVNHGKPIPKANTGAVKSAVKTPYVKGNK